MNIKVIKIRSNTTNNKTAILELEKLGYNVIKFSVDRRKNGKQKVVEVIRSHIKYGESLNSTLLFEGVISILNWKEFWKGSPDFIIWNEKEIYFCEFKSKQDSFRLNQLDWFERFDMLPTAIAFCVGK